MVGLPCPFCGSPFGCLCGSVRARQAREQAETREAREFYERHQHLGGLEFTQAAIAYGREQALAAGRQEAAPPELPEAQTRRRFERLDLGEAA